MHMHSVSPPKAKKTVYIFCLAENIREQLCIITQQFAEWKKSHFQSPFFLSLISWTSPNRFTVQVMFQWYKYSCYFQKNKNLLSSISKEDKDRKEVENQGRRRNSLHYMKWDNSARERCTEDVTSQNKMKNNGRVVRWDSGPLISVARRMWLGTVVPRLAGSSDHEILYGPKCSQNTLLGIRSGYTVLSET